jgi:hypothetical protein
MVYSQKVWLGVIVATGLMVLLSGAASNEQPLPWEYATAMHMGFPALNTGQWITTGLAAPPDPNSSLPTVLNKFGENRWELVAVLEGASGNAVTETFYFKRPK